MSGGNSLSGAEIPSAGGRVALEQIADWETLIVEARYSPRLVCARCGYSMRHVQRFILEKFKMNLGWYVSAVRMVKAYNLLKSGFTVKETAHGLGFKQVSHFCRCFKRHFQANPSTVLLSSGISGKDGGAGDGQLQLEFMQPVARTRLRRKKPGRKAKPKTARKRKRDA
jgi:AraC-like DNA-binding protein